MKKPRLPESTNYDLSVTDEVFTWAPFGSEMLIIKYVSVDNTSRIREKAATKLAALDAQWKDATEAEKTRVKALVSMYMLSAQVGQLEKAWPLVKEINNAQLRSRDRKLLTAVQETTRRLNEIAAPPSMFEDDVRLLMQSSQESINSKGASLE
jgi:hypothetical protein